MSSTAQRRKGGAAVSSASRSTPQSPESPPRSPHPSTPFVVNATVRRKFCGTGPFDRHWLNMDCCGLFCAMITYCLHLYALYTICFILIPPWMSEVLEIAPSEGATALSQRRLTWMGVIHRTAFATLTVLAMVSHFKAMTTDPGTVPPDAKPTEEMPPPDAEPDAVIPRKGHRLCRRCKSFKPARAHHCSVCRRCIIKMDHHW